MRYYIFSVQYNKESGGENRTVPVARDTYNEAVAAYYDQLAKDTKNTTLGWSFCMIINDAMGVEKSELYLADGFTLDEATRHYVFSVQHNKETMSENRTVPKAFNSKNEAIGTYHRTLSSDYFNSILDWSICMVINNKMEVEKQEKFIAEAQPEVINE